MLSDEQITKYQILHKNRYGTEISRAEACNQGIKLVRMMQLIYRRTTETERQKLKKRRADTGIDVLTYILKNQEEPKLTT